MVHFFQITLKQQLAIYSFLSPVVFRAVIFQTTCISLHKGRMAVDSHVHKNPFSSCFQTHSSETQSDQISGAEEFFSMHTQTALPRHGNERLRIDCTSPGSLLWAQPCASAQGKLIRCQPVCKCSAAPCLRKMAFLYSGCKAGGQDAADLNVIYICGSLCLRLPFWEEKILQKLCFTLTAKRFLQCNFNQVVWWNRYRQTPQALLLLLSWQAVCMSPAETSKGAFPPSFNLSDRLILSL